MLTLVCTSSGDSRFKSQHNSLDEIANEKKIWCNNMKYNWSSQNTTELITSILRCEVSRLDCVSYSPKLEYNIIHEFIYKTVSSTHDQSSSVCRICLNLTWLLTICEDSDPQDSTTSIFYTLLYSQLAITHSSSSLQFFVQTSKVEKHRLAHICTLSVLILTFKNSWRSQKMLCSETCWKPWTTFLVLELKIFSKKLWTSQNRHRQKL